MPSIRAVFFDLDGVLIDSYLVWYQLLRQATVHFGFEALTLEAYARTWGQGTDADVKSFMPGRTVQEVEAFYDLHQPEHLHHVRLEPGAAEVLEAVRMRLHPLPRRRAVAVMTNTPTEMARRALDRVGLLDLLDRVLGADEAGASKPAPNGLLKLCQHFGVDPAEAVMIGDSIYDRGAAEAAGMPFVGLRLDAPHRLESLLDLPGWLEKFEHGRL